MDKAKFKVNSTKPFREQVKEGEAEGRLGQEFRLEGNLPLSKCKGLYSSKQSFELLLGNLYNSDTGELLTEDADRAGLKTMGRACKVTILWGLTDTTDFEECTFDCIKVLPEKGKIVNVRARLRAFPNAKQQSKVNAFLKNDVTMILNGETAAIQAGDEDPDQAELPMGAPKDEEDQDPPSAGPGEALPGVPAAHKESVESLREAGVLTKASNVKPSLAHGEPAIPGGKPPQRPRRRPGGESIQ